MRPKMKPKFYRDGVNGKANPECDTEELPRFKMCPSAGREKNAHYRPSCSNAEQYSNRARHPAPFQQILAGVHVSIGARQRKQKQTIEEEHCGAFHPSANRICAHGVGCKTDRSSQWETTAAPPIQIPSGAGKRTESAEQTPSRAQCEQSSEQRAMQMCRRAQQSAAERFAMDAQLPPAAGRRQQPRSQC